MSSNCVLVCGFQDRVSLSVYGSYGDRKSGRLNSLGRVVVSVVVIGFAVKLDNPELDYANL